MSDSISALPGLQTIWERERLLLAPFAMHSSDSAGRRHPEPEHPYRGPFQRDRDRILHCSAFRRLSGKTQVFTGDMGDYHRTRLTHTFEVASIARTIGRSLRLNEDLIEALALFHDIGHPPFGHAGEDALDECLAEFGGFSHNQHALTIAEELESRYHSFPGLNLCQEVLDGQTTRVDKRSSGLKPLLEVQVVDAADSITYDAHDTDDALKVGLVTLDQMKEIPLIVEICHQVRLRFTAIGGDLLRKAVVHALIDFQVGDLLRHCGPILAANAFANAEQARRSSFTLGPSPELKERKIELESFLYQRVYRHPQLLAVRQAAQCRLQEMFQGYRARPELLPRQFQQRIETHGLARSIGEYLAGMTDRYCDQQYERWFRNERGG
jgi:dGTPase